MMDERNEKPQPEAQSGEPDTPNSPPGLRPKNVRLLAWLREWRQTELTDEERQILDDFDAFRRAHPVSFASTSEK